MNYKVSEKGLSRFLDEMPAQGDHRDGEENVEFRGVWRE